MSNEKSSYEPLIIFKDQTKPFSLGFELGRIWGQAESDNVPIETLIHLESREEVENILLGFGVIPTFTPYSDDGWLLMQIVPEDFEL